MEKLTLYHGSQCVVYTPVFGKGKKTNDYGSGFYCTENIELAKEWACSELRDGFVNCYELDTSNLKILDLTSSDYSILNWLAILLDNRITEMRTPVSRLGQKYIIDNFLPEYKDFDLIVGYRADDSYFSFARSFVENGISLNQLAYAMKLGNLGQQVVLKSEKSFELIKFKDYSIAECSEYFKKRKDRDDEARKAFGKELERQSVDGIFMQDILREKMRSDDARLR